MKMEVCIPLILSEYIQLIASQVWHIHQHLHSIDSIDIFSEENRLSMRFEQVRPDSM